MGGSTIRQPIITILAHVDHGKTTLLDSIRSTAIAKKEAGGITQEIGATVVPVDTVKSLCGEKLKKMGIELTLSGLLFIDTPGHEAFTNLRKRGGSIADLAVLLIDINEGLQPQTLEAIEILKTYKVPFIVAANKIDRLFGWKPMQKACFSDSFAGQDAETRKRLDEKTYMLVGELYKHGFNCERFDRVDDFTKQIVIIPTSGKTGEGIPELLLYIAGLCQKYLDLKTDVSGPGKGTVLEVKEVRGLGATIDVIVYDGVVKKGDRIVVCGRRGCITTNVRALLQPKPLEEIRDPKKKFHAVDEVHASCGVKIAAPGLDEALPGSTLLVAVDEENAKRMVEEEVESIEVQTDQNGIVLKTDSLGSLEAVTKLLMREGIPVRSASVGQVTKREVIEAAAVRENDRYLGAVFGFNTKVLPEAEEEAGAAGVKIISTRVVYELIDEYGKWKEEEARREKDEALRMSLSPVKLKVMPGYVFRQSNPAICGVEVLEGTLKKPCPLINGKGRRVGRVHGIQKDKENVGHADKGEQVAVSIEGATIGRQINEGDILFTNIPLREFHELEKVYSKKEEGQLLEEIREIKKSYKEETR
ncbi:MAG: translation initiation factor IF-2 [Candidatus Diapherotrites archaeon]|nr:translation initiation factor IF-2 [Candidatus Diapherotrites archaeon]